jgi:hypothetical protein
MIHVMDRYHTMWHDVTGFLLRAHWLRRQYSHSCSPGEIPKTACHQLHRRTALVEIQPNTSAIS